MNSQQPQNPFTITRAVDLTDKQILDLWVELRDEDNSLVEIIKPTSLMPMFVVGGKGSGKTHLIRYVSFQTRRLMYKDDMINGLIKDGFLAVYLRCGGLNSSRFAKKGIPDDQWADIFAYYIELWIAEKLIDIISVINECYNEPTLEIAFCEKALDLFDIKPEISIRNLNGLLSHLIGLRKELDYFSNNCIYGDLKAPLMQVTRGQLIYKLPNIFNEIYMPNHRIIFQYMLDEFENFNDNQQIYINSLVRERSGDCSIKVGTRLFGIRTLKTLCADEENKEGSEFETLNLDEFYRDNREYRTFALRLINSRLHAYKMDNPNNSDFSALDDDISCFYQYRKSALEDDFLTPLAQKKELEKCGYYKKFKKHIQQELSTQEVETIDQILISADRPLLQKAIVYIVYSAMANKKTFDFSSLQDDIALSIATASFKGIFEKRLHHFKSDFIAQLCKEYKTLIPYGGLDGIIDLSMGNPRHLLILLKHIFDWAIYRNEVHKSPLCISLEAQNSGIQDASNWFFSDAKLIGADGDQVQNAIDRLCGLFRSIRYSDKPSECSVCAFSVDMSTITSRAKSIIDIAKKWSLIIDVGTHNTKHTSNKTAKFQINKLLSPRWGIATSRRGTLQLTAKEVNAIFDDDYANEYNQMKDKRLARLNYPFKVQSCDKHQSIKRPKPAYPSLWDDL